MNRTRNTSSALRQVSVMLTPLAYWHLQWLCQRTDCEVSAMGILAEDEPGLTIEEFILAKQSVSAVTVDLDMVWWADKQVELYDLRQIEPWRTSCWAHTHPAGVNRPSGTDEATMEKSFGDWDFALMLILTKAGVFYGRLEFEQALAGIKTRLSIPARFIVDWLRTPDEIVTAETLGKWEAEFKALVEEGSAWDELMFHRQRRTPAAANGAESSSATLELKGGDGHVEQHKSGSERSDHEYGQELGEFTDDWYGRESQG